MNPYDNLKMFDHAGNAQNALMQGMQVGTQLRQQREMREREAALDNTYRGLMAGDTTAVNSLANMPGMAGEAYKMKVGIDRQAADSQEAGRKQMLDLANLLDDSTDEASYQRNLSVAQQLYGQLPPTVPQNFDPNWIDQQKRIVSVMMSEPQKLTTMAQELVNAGYEPGTPDFVQQMRQRIALSDTKIISTTDGGMAGTLGPSGYNPVILPNPGNMPAGAPAGAPVRVSSPQEADALPPGTRFIDPNGIERQVPGGQPGGNRPFDGTFNPRGISGERVTSTFRSPQRNAQVGGVSNSFHKRRGVDGRPLARDSVPPPGMSMGEYARRLRALNPDYDVINEGDHVHMEPKG
jgi:hypothetical protein